MKFVHLTVIVLCLSLAVNAQRSLSLEEALEYAVQNSNNVRLAQMDLTDAEAQIQEVRATAIPTLAANVQYQHFIDLPKSLLPLSAFGGPEGEFAVVEFGLKNNLTTTIDVNAIIFDPTVFVGLKAAKVYRELVVKQLDQTKSELRYNVAKSYLAALIAQKNKEVLDKNIANLEVTFKETQAFYKEGFIEKLDVDRLELSLNNLRSQAENVSQLIVLSYNLLKFQMGMPLTEVIELTDNIDILVGNTLVEDINIAENQLDITKRPEYDVIKAGQTLNEMNIQSIKAGNLPSLYAFGTQQLTLQRDNVFDSDQPGWLNATIVGAQLKIPIFDYTRKYKLQQAQVDLQKTQIQYEEFVNATNLEYANAKIAYLNAKRNVTTSQNSLDLAQSIHNTTQIKYREGVGSSLEVTQAEADLYQAQGNYIASLYDLLVAKTDLEKALGNF